MAIRQHTGWILLAVIVLVAASAVFGATRRHVDSYQTVTYTSANLQTPAPKTIDVPKLSDVKYVQINFGMPTPSPKPLLSNTPQNRAKISKLLSWLQQAKPLGYERPHPMPTIGPISLDIKLYNGKDVVLQPALNSVTHLHNDSPTLVEGRTAKNEIDFDNGSDKSIRLDSSQLYTWLAQNGWKQDIPWKS